MQAVLDALWTHRLPGLLPEGAPAPSDAAEAELTERLGGLSLPSCAGSAGPAGSWTLTVTPAPRVGLTSVRLASRVDRSELTLADGQSQVTVPVGVGEWEVSEPLDAAGDPLPLAVSGGWEDDGRFRAEVLFLETPHRLDLVLDVGAGKADVSWRRIPLGSTRLADLHRPHPR
jgi:hypothetical protein